jgi:glycosyltransferase involved in cell wall biosynthesis
MKIYCPNSKEDGIGGGFTFWRNFKNGMAGKVHFVDTWQECDVFFITGVTVVNKEELYEAHKQGKKIVLRVDNVPRKSRNKRSTPHERLREFAGLADVVIYQSGWAKDYCYPLCGDGTVIYNGVDQDTFRPAPDKQVKNRYLFAYHGKNEQKNISEAFLRYQYIHRADPTSELWFIYRFHDGDQKSIERYETLKAANFDFWNGERVRELPQCRTPEEMADLLQRCGGLIYPSISDASPNIVLEARSSGCKILYPAPKELAGTQELIDLKDISLERMCEEYYGVFLVVMENI